MKARVVTQITIAAGKELVFKYLQDMHYHYLWNPQIQSLKPITKLQIGTKYEAVSQVLGVKITAKNVVTKLQPNTELELENNTGMVHYCTNFTLSTKGQDTVLVCTTAVSSESKAFAFAKPVMERLARRELQTDLQALKIAVEHRLK